MMFQAEKVERQRRLPLDLLLLILGFVFLIFTIGGIVYFIGFLSNNIFSALAPGEDSGERIEFDLEGFNSLGIK